MCTHVKERGVFPICSSPYFLGIQFSLYVEFQGLAALADQEESYIQH